MGFVMFARRVGPQSLWSASMLALVVSAPAAAQTGQGEPASESGAVIAAPARQAPSEDLPGQSTEITVTASRIPTGFAAPTPTTVLGAAQIAETAPVQISEALALIPAFRSSGASSSAAVYANLRSIGATRTLVLVDGRRHVPTTAEGTFDLNLIPTAMVGRTEVVTGGASASWGSDAVAGVINLILRSDLEGIEASGQMGLSEYGDSFNYTAALTGGTSFADGRGRILIGGEYAGDRGIGDLQYPDLSRPWAYEMRDRVSNSRFATNGLPGVIYSRDVRRADTSRGGLITNGPLAGQAFNADGSMYSFGYGQVFGNNMIGGTDNLGETTTPGSDLRYPLERYSLLGRTEFDLASSLTAFLEGSYAHSLSNGHTNALRFQGAVTGTPTTSCTGTTAPSNLGGILVGIDNPFLPAATRAAMQSSGVTCIPVGRTFRELDTLEFNDGTDSAYRGVIGLRGDLGGSWKWDTYFQYGKSKSQQLRIGNLNMAAFRNAINAVTAPGGQIVCAINADSSSENDDGQCVPLNIFGAGSVTPDAAAYVQGTSSLITEITQKVAAINLSGEPLDLWAGPLGVAFGAEYREESIVAVADARSEAGGWQTGNRRGTDGKVDVKEIYGEVNLPLVDDLAWTRSLAVNGAVRYTDYSSSGGVVTWKVGAVWEPIDDVLVRATRSRDIRAGNLGELFTAVSTATASGLRNPVTGESSPLLVLTRGNRNLAPEEADTWTAGVAYSPSWASGLRLSADYYSIKINGAIGTLTPQQIIDRCYLDQLAEFCSLVTTNTTGRITQVETTQLNLNKFETSGFDFEVAYRMPLDISRSLSGDLSLRLLANYVDKLATTAAINAQVTDPAGQYTTPHWSIFGNIGYDVGRLRTVLDLRWFEGGAIDNTLTEGAASATGVNINHVGSTFYANATITYVLDEAKDREIFVRVNNLFDSWPPFPSNGGGIFDEAGRSYRVGFRTAF